MAGGLVLRETVHTMATISGMRRLLALIPSASSCFCFAVDAKR